MTSPASYEEILNKFSTDEAFRTRLITQTEAVLKEFGIAIPSDQLESVGLPKKETSGIKPLGFIFNSSVVLYSGSF